MRLIPIHLCKPGMRLGRKIYSHDGKVLLAESTVLTKTMIRRLAALGISFIYVYDERTDDVELREWVDAEVRARAIAEIRRQFRRMMDEGGRKRHIGAFDKTFRSMLSALIDELASHPNAIMLLGDICTVDHYLYRHSLNVCLYAIGIGISLGWDRDRLMTFGLGALLHDIGKLMVPQDILLKPGKLTPEEFEAVKRHTEAGFDLLRGEPNIPMAVAYCALQHHERLDGSGYPRGLKADEIQELAQWIGLIDAYDAMTSMRPYRKMMLPHEALEVLYAGSGTLFDTKKIWHFRNQIAIYPIGMTVTLSTGETGVVVDLNAGLPDRPVVRIFRDAEGVELSQPYELDLSKKLNVVVTGVDEYDLLAERSEEAAGEEEDVEAFDVRLRVNAIN
ncbi:MAG: hypothetical protein BLM47_12165 [Candidatus Reconcilbacillus cellulovorans]|uniref:HD-GYP domain-containing protein n=1 Tax=Candidatus Reconcilbacillus cellulovorans TaxID=1906605 RepID=A0A2A6DXR1_9BACL|nr:MAG: hypothetical protein BLM47_12165 [Candidatus Reconcilbacillus cellulovorans]